MQTTKFLLIAAAAVVVTSGLSSAQAATITTLPDLPDMRMIDLEIVWNDQPTAKWDAPRDYSQGGKIKVGGTSFAPHVHTEAAQRLAQYGWPLENAGAFSPGDVFASPLNVLNGTAFGRSFGWSSWLSADAVSKGYLWKVVQTASSPDFKTFNVYSPYFEELHTSATGFAITWDGHYLLNGAIQHDDPASGDYQGWNGPNWMLHPVFAAPAQVGDAYADYTISLVDGAGNVVTNVTPGYARLTFSAYANILHAVPMQGGMVMPMVAYHASTGKLTVMLGSTVPQLTPLLVSNPGDAFDPADPWFDFLDPSRQGLSFSRRYGFVMDGNTDLLPAGMAIWIRKLSSSPGLGVYRYRNTDPIAWEPIFGTGGSSNALQWDGMMFHPGVTAPPGTNSLTATFELYLVDTTTGLEVPGSTAGPLVLNWTNVSDGRPSLDIAAKVVVAWPAAASGYVLESADTASASVWTAVTNTPVTLDGQSAVLLDPHDATKFFRMRKAP